MPRRDASDRNRLPARGRPPRRLRRRDQGPGERSDRHRGAELFYERCSGCHTFTKANAYGSKPAGQLQGGERTNGPNFDVRHVAKEDALFAIRNGGFSGAIMPANVVTGRQAEEVADFLDKYSGQSN